MRFIKYTALIAALLVALIAFGDALVEDSLSVRSTEAESQLVDARNPEEWRMLQDAIPVERWSRWPWVRIQELETEQRQLMEKIRVLPQHKLLPLSDHVGYHSPFVVPNEGEPIELHQINFRWFWAPRLDSIALAPAFDPKGSEIYAFPKRFKIEVFNVQTQQFETVVDWMQQDFPDPGPYPVFFADIDRFVTEVRITVPQLPRDSGVAYYALGEVYLFRKRPDGSTGETMTQWGADHVQIEDSVSFSMKPLWDLDYLHDAVVCLGFPLSNETVDSEDLMIPFEKGAGEVQLILDLERTMRIGRIDFWPAEAPNMLALPSFGFPGALSVELSDDPNFAPGNVLFVANAEDGNKHSESILSVATRSVEARYIRITVNDLFEYQGRRILGLGEILVTEQEQSLSIGREITAVGLPVEYLDQLPRLVDGYSWHRRILPQGDWIRGLAQRRPLDARLAIVELELDAAYSAWREIKILSAIWAVGFVVMGLIGGLLVQRIMRQRGINKLKWRIARDLHDDVGSSLGSISLTVEQLKDAEMGAEAREDLGDLSLLAREACASLREVMWVIDERTIRLPDLIQKLAERAERVLHGIEVSIVVSSEIPDAEVSLTFKRHLIMLFKEAIHNCARHAQATCVSVTFFSNDSEFTVTVRDDGCGFDPAVKSAGWGLNSMKERAQEMGGEATLNSRLGKGTTVILTVPLNCLLNKVDHLYTTSN